MSSFATVEEAIEEIRNGNMIVVVDDEDRENEGDLIVAADKCTPEHINFMATHAKGLICTPVEGFILDRLKIGQMVVNNTDNHETAFTVSVDATSTTTGISAFERCQTVKEMIDPNSKPEDFRRPGHVFPLRSVPGAYCAGQATPRLLLTWPSWQASLRLASAVRLWTMTGT